MLLKRLSAIMLICMLLSSCVKEEIDVSNLGFDMNPQFGLPIAHASIRADRLIDHFDDDGFLQVDGNQAISLVYTDTLLSLEIDKLLSLPYQSYSDQVTLTAVQISDLISEGSITVVHDSWWSFESPQGDRIDSLRFANGNFSLEILSPNSFPVSGHVRVFSVDNTESFSFDFEDMTSPVNISNQANYQNVLLKFLNDDEFENGLRVQYEFTFHFEPGIVGGPVDFTIGVGDFSIASVGGYIAPRTIAIDGLDAKLTFFDGYNGSVQLADPRLKFYCSNGFGLGLNIDIISLVSKNANGEVLAYQDSGIPVFPNIAQALSPFTPVETILGITNANLSPNLTQFMAFRPTYVEADVEVGINPEQVDHQFATSTSGFDITFEAEIPLYGSLSDFHLQDTVEVDLGDLVDFANETGELEDVEVKLDIVNGFPIDVTAQIILFDSNFNPIDSLFAGDEAIFISAPINTNVDQSHPDYGRSIGQTKKQTIIALSNERASALRDVTQMIIRVNGSTSNQGNQIVRFFATDRFDVSLAVKAALTFP